MTGSITTLMAVMVMLPAAAKPPAPLGQKTQGRLMTGTLLRYQQAYYLENSVFTKTIDDLAPPETFKTQGYRHQMTLFTQLSRLTVMIVSQPTKPGLPTYVGLVRSSDYGPIDLLCESTRATAISVSQKLIEPADSEGSSTCPTGFVALNRL
jgi:type IV pilus assembly protein PilA